MGSYELLAPHLDIPESLVDAIQRDTIDDPNQGKLRLLQLWKERRGCGATFLSLAQAFLVIDDRHCAECIVSHAKHLSLSRIPNRGDVFPDQTIPSWEDMPKEEKEALKEQLLVEVEEVKDKYASCLTDIATSFRKRCIDIDDIKMLLLSKLKATDTLSYEIEAAPTIRRVFVTLAKHTSWFNHQLLEFTLQKFGSDEEKRKWSEYQEAVLKPYLMRSLFRVPSKSFSSSATADGPAIYLCLKLVEDVDLSAKETLLIKRKLSELLEVPTLELSSYDVGSVILIFAIPKDVFNLYPPDSVLHQYIEYDKDEGSYYISANITTIL